MNPFARRNARHYALQAMYQWHMAGDTSHHIEAEFIAHQITKKIDLDYFKELIHGIPREQEALDEQFKSFLPRPISELDPVELAILRIATFEFIHRPDIPFRVVLNEALDLAKKFGSIEGFKFVNGVLDQVARKTRSVEVAAHKNK